MIKHGVSFSESELIDMTDFDYVLELAEEFCFEESEAVFGPRIAGEPPYWDDCGAGLLVLEELADLKDALGNTVPEEEFRSAVRAGLYRLRQMILDDSEL